MARGGYITVAIVVALTTLGSFAYADPDPAAPTPRVIDVPTAWLQPREDVYASAGADHRGGGFGALSLGFAGIAELGVVTSDRLVFCEKCDASGDRDLHQAWTTSASFRIGIPEDTWLHGLPAIVLGFERSFAGVAPPLANGTPAVAQLYVVASERLGPVRMHLGASAWAASYHGTTGDPVDLGTTTGRTLRPFAALEWTPTQYPRTTVMAELSWIPELGPDAAALTWEGAWGVRYQALDWASIELGVRHRQLDDLSGATVFVRVNIASGARSKPARAPRSD